MAAGLSIVGIGSATQSNDGRDVWVEGDHAYVGAGYDGGLHIWDVGDPTDPQYVTRLDDGMVFGRGVEVVNDVCYVACRDSNEFVTVDVSDPSDPSVIGRVGTDSGGDLDGARGIDVQGDYAFVSVGHFNSTSSPSEGEGLTVVDVSDPSNPSIVTNLDGGDADMHAAGDAHYVDGYVYLSGYQDGSVMVVDVSDPTNPQHATTWDSGRDDARGLDSRNDVLFANSPADDELIAVDISDPSDLSEIGSVSDSRLAGGRANSLDGTDLFVSARSSNQCVWVDVSDPSDMSVVSSVSSSSLEGAYGSFTDGEYVYTSAAGSGDFVISDPRDET